MTTLFEGPKKKKDVEEAALPPSAGTSMFEGPSRRLDPNKNKPLPGLGTEARALDDFVRSMASGITLGGFDPMLEATGLEPGAVEATEAARERSPIAATGGNIAGTAMTAAMLSRLLGGAVPVLGANTIPSIMANQGITGAGLSIGEDVIAGETPDVGKAALQGGIGSALGGIFSGLSRALFPRSRVRAWGSDLTDADRMAAQQVAAQAGNAGVPLTAAEAVATGAPGRSAKVTAGYDTAAATPKGSQNAANFERARVPKVEAAKRAAADAVGPGADPFTASQVAKEALKTEKEIVSGIADPFYKAAGPVRLNIPDTAARTEAMRQVGRDPVVMGALSRELTPPSAPVQNAAYFEDIFKRSLGRDVRIMQGQGGNWTVWEQGANGQLTRVPKSVASSPEAAATRAGLPRQSIAGTDAVRKQIGANFERAERAGSGVSSLRAGELAEDARVLNDLMDVASPDYAVGRGAFEGGMEAVDRLSVGPLGKLAKTPTAEGQGKALFGATNTVDQRAAEEAIDLLGNPTAKGILANRADAAASAGSKLFATPQERALGQKVLGQDFPLVNDTLEAVGSMRPMPNATADTRGGSPIGTLWHKIMDTGSGGAVRAANDPSIIPELGTIGVQQRGVLALGAGTADEAVDGMYKKRRKRR